MLVKECHRRAPITVPRLVWLGGGLAIVTTPVADIVLPGLR